MVKEERTGETKQKNQCVSTKANYSNNNNNNKQTYKCKQMIITALSLNNVRLNNLEKKTTKKNQKEEKQKIKWPVTGLQKNRKPRYE